MAQGVFERDPRCPDPGRPERRQRHPANLGEFSVKEVFVETRVPLLKDAPFVKELGLLAAYRAGDYSSVGRTNSWNAGFEWSPVDDVKVRGTRSCRPARRTSTNCTRRLARTSRSGLNDPCLGVTATSTGPYAGACRAAPGVNANIAANGKFTLNQADLQGISGYNRGNPKLDAEKGRSTTVGVVVDPAFDPDR